MKSGKKFTGKIAKTLVSAALMLLCAGAVYMLWEQAPQQKTAQPSVAAATATAAAVPSVSPTGRVPFTPAPTPSAEPTLEAAKPEAPASGRTEGVYTVLVVGNDDGNGNTDTIMVGRFNTVEHKIDFVSIPRDTLVNIDWKIRKINAVYWGDVNSGGNGIDMLRDQVENLIGFQVDCYAVVDLDVLEEAVDALGGVYFDVPMAMDYEDASQDLYIHIQPGYQLLNGDQALGVCRYRSSYVTGDLGRIDMQHQFLRACMEQFIDLGKLPNMAKVLGILADGIDTDMTTANMAYFVRQALKCSSEDINFYTMPTTDDYIGGLSYTIVDLNNWLPMVNEYLNPYYEEIAVSNLDIVYNDNGVITGTAGLKGAWYYAGL